MNIRELKEMPDCVGNVHESTLKSNQVLKKVVIMLERGDSPETILELIDYLFKKQ